MSDEQHPPAKPDSGTPDPDQEDPPSSGPNLTLIYSLIALALAAAIGLALMIVLPFYHRR
jgi:hypothetical protein